MNIEGDISILATPHVAKNVQRKGYSPVLNELLLQYAILDSRGVDGLLRQHKNSVASWSLTIPGRPTVHLRPNTRVPGERPLDGVIYLFDSYMHGSLVGEWKTPDDVAEWVERAA